MSHEVDERERSETTVKNRSGYADRLHRPDPDADEPTPTCRRGPTTRSTSTTPCSASQPARVTGAHYQTVLNALERNSEVLRHEFGPVEFAGRYVAQQLVERTGALLENVSAGLDAIDDREEGPRISLQFGDRPTDLGEARAIIEEGVTALGTTLGAETADRSRVMRWGPEFTLQDGTPVENQPGLLG